MDEAAARGERLRQLRAAAAEAGEDQPAAVPAAQPPAPEEPQLRFRNYNVHDKKHISHSTIEAAQPPDYEEPKANPEVLPSLDADVRCLQLLCHTDSPCLSRAPRPSAYW